jgi:hypothetical protein
MMVQRGSARAGWAVPARRENAMSRRKLDLILSTGGIIGAILVLALGLVFQGLANYSKDYTADQLGAQQIFFTPVAGLHGEQDAPGGECLVTYAEQQLLTGKQAECYANQYIAFHLAASAEGAGYPGATYATMGGIINGLKADLETATTSGQPLDDGRTAEQIQEQVTAATALRETMFKGESLRGLLLTVYGFSVFGELGGIAAIVCYLAAVVLVVLSIAGFLHARRTAPDEKVLA